jgi:AcrR family transcriptional regulator
MDDGQMGPSGQRRGRGARERVLDAAEELFRTQGINSTGIDELCARAAVSKRTIYQHFGNKDGLIAAYLGRLNENPVDAFERPGPAPRDRLLAIFEDSLTGGALPLCPFIGAAVEIADPDHPARAVARDYKRSITNRLVETARDAGADSPEQLGEQLGLLLDGASARTRTLGDDALPTAIGIARVLIDASIPVGAHS